MQSLGVFFKVDLFSGPQSGEYILEGHLLLIRNCPLNSLSKSTKLPLKIETPFPPTTPNSILHLAQFSYLPSNINLSDPFVIILWILSIAYLLNKDLRIGVLLSLIFLILYEKHKQNAINKQVLHTYMKNISIEQRLEILEDQKK